LALLAQGEGTNVDAQGPRAHQSSILRDTLFIVFKRKIPLVVMFVIGLAIVTYGIQTKVSEYEATARVLIKRDRQAYEMPTETQHVFKRSEVVNTELQIIKSAAVAELVVDRLGLGEDGNRGMAIARIENRIQAMALPESDIIDIKFRDTDPARAAQVVNTALDAWLDIRKGVELSTQALGYLERQADKARAARDSVAAEMAALGATEGAHELGRQVSMQMSLQGRYRDALVKIEKDIDSRERQLAVAEGWLESGRVVSGSTTEAVYDSESVRRANTALAELEIDLADIRARYREDHPEVRRIERQIAATESVLVAGVEQALRDGHLRLEELRAERDAIRGMLGELRAADRKIADTELQLRLLQHDMSLRVDLYEVIMNRMEQFRITVATDPSLLNVGIISRASVPVRPTPRPVNMRVVVGVFLVLFGILLVFALEKMDQSLQSREDVQRHLGVKVLASIPDRRFHRQRR
jgi:uncharacterized protein involved in exopolysaccharide biosynthesis